MRAAVIIGHDDKDQGAVNEASGVTEFKFLEKLAHSIKNNFSKHNENDEILVVYRENGLRNLPDDVNKHDVDLVVSLHANAFNTQVEGCETLYYHKSVKGKHIAQIFQDKVRGAMLNKDRGIKSKSSEDRGGYILKYTDAPCVLCEPFFIDNNIDYGVASELLENMKLTNVFCEAINVSLEYLREV